MCLPAAGTRAIQNTVPMWFPRTLWNVGWSEPLLFQPGVFSNELTGGHVSGRATASPVAGADSLTPASAGNSQMQCGLPQDARAVCLLVTI